MSENLGNLRASYTDIEPVSGEEVNVYLFVESAIEIPDEPENGDWASKMLEYKELYERTELARKNKQMPNPQDVEEKKILHAELEKYLSARFKAHRKSILKGSLSVPRKPDAEGKDSQVYYYGSVTDFLARPDTPRYVSKYSHDSKEAESTNIVYFRKKYQMMQKLLAEHIPRAWFVLGEFRHGIPKHEQGFFRTSLRAVTIQREIRGKTFAEMTPSARRRPEVQRALKEAVTHYRAARNVLRKACDEVKVSHKAFEMGLDIGRASSEDVTEPFDPLNYESPNVMYDERKKKVFFIDMGWGEWTKEKEAVFEKIMGRKRKKRAA